MPNYQNSKIYKIISPSNPDLIYYGSTTQKLYYRMVGHKNKNNSTSKKILCFDDAIIVLVESYPCNTKEELLKKEREYILNNNCVNKQIPCRTQKQWREDNKDYIKKYNENNKDKIIEYNKRKREKRQLNKEEANLKQKQYRELIKYK
jgi:hypothetical protein